MPNLKKHGLGRLRHALPEGVIGCLEADPAAPFADDTEYLKFIAAEVTAYLRLMACRSQIETKAVEGGPGYSDLSLARLQKTSASLLACKKRLEEVIISRCGVRDAVWPGPRLVRVARKLGMKDKELRAVEYMVAYCTGLGLVGGGEAMLFAFRDKVAAAVEFAGMSPAEFMEFIFPHRLHIVQGLFEINSQLSSSAFRDDFKIGSEVLKALAGGKLSAQEYLKIDKTALAETLAEEPGFSLGAVDLSGRPAGPAGDGDGQPQDPEAVSDDPAGEPGVSKCGGNTIDALHGVTSALGPYTADLEYLDDYFRLIATLLKIKELETGDDRFRHSSEPSKETELRELRARERVYRGVIETRLALSKKAGSWRPRLEQLAESRNLDAFEKNVVATLVGSHISQEIEQAAGSRAAFQMSRVRGLLQMWCEGLEQQIAHRKYFYRSARLVKDGIINIDADITNELEGAQVDIDRRMLDYIVGLDVEATELVEGGHLYTPRVKLDQVVLPREMKELMLGRVEHFAAFGRARRDLGFEETISYGKSLVMLFFGPSGTGKTMMANALANHLAKKVFLINFPSLGGIAAGAVLRYIFREAKIQDAIVFFDECEELFKARGEGNASISTLLTEIERHDGMVIMATNRPFELDEAMHRRITLALEFRNPDLHLREQIWKNHLPPAVKLAGDVNFAALASGFELSGGFIKNAVLTALSLAVEREGASPVICMADLEKGARLQLRSRLRLADFDRRVVPTQGLDALVLPTEIRQRLLEVVSFEKAREVLFGQWGFDAHMSYGLGMTVLFHGRPGTGKSFAAEALGYEIGRPLMVVNCAELISKYVGDTPKNLDNLFKDARQNECIVVFDEADGLFAARTAVSDSTDRYANVDVGVLLYHIERYPGVVILTTNLVDNVDEAFFRRMKHVLEFPMPDAGLREMLWKKLIPPKTPVAADVDFAGLAKRHDLSGGNIKNAIFRAAARAALRPGENRMITAVDLVEAAEEETAKERKPGIGF